MYESSWARTSIFCSKGKFMRKKSVRTASMAINQFHSDDFLPCIIFHAWRTCQPHLISLTIFDLDLRVAPQKPLQEIWWHEDVDSISSSNDCVFKRVDDVNKSSNDIPWDCKGDARRNSTCTDDGGGDSVKSEPLLLVLSLSQWQGLNFCMSCPDFLIGGDILNC